MRWLVSSPAEHHFLTRARLAILIAVTGIHALGAWALSTSTPIRPMAVEQSLHAVLMLTNNPARVTDERLPLVPDAVVLQDPSEPVISLPPPPVFGLAERNSGAVTVAPQLVDSDQPTVAPYAHQAGLLPGESAVVILRIEVLPDGHAGQIEIDVSSGSQQVDEAAVAYAQRFLWVPGSLSGMDTRIWVRQSVRLAA
jgi:TonB family protein